VSKTPEFTPEQLRKLADRIGRDIEAWLDEHTIEPHYSAETVAGLLEVVERTVWNYIELYETSQGKDGIGPVVKLSHKVVRIPASAIKRFLASRTIEVRPPASVEAHAA
jgi:hypothetical protein